MNGLIKLLAALCVLFALAGCGSSGSSANPPNNLTVTAGDGRVTLTWTMEPDVQYWVYYAPAASISVDNWTSIANSQVMMEVTSPLVISGLTNGTTYAFTMDARVDKGPRGDATPSIAVVPRYAATAWSAATGQGTGDLRAAAYGGIPDSSTLGYVAVGAGGKIYTSLEGDAWAAQSNDAASTDLTGVAYGGSHYVAVGAGGGILYSKDKVTWTADTSPTTQDINGVASNASNFYVAVGNAGTILHSSDGKTWTVDSSGTSSDLLGVAYGNGRYFATGRNGVLLTSTDGSTWSLLASGTTAHLRSAAYGIDSSTKAGRYIVVGDAGTVLTSTDGTTWTVESALTTENLNVVTYGTEFVIVGNGGTVFNGTTGTSWTAQTSGTTANLYGLAHSTYSYVALGASGTGLLAK